MIVYEDALDDIVTALGDVITSGVDISKLPENEADYKRVANTPRILVSFLGSDFETQLTTSEAGQDETINFGVEITYKKLYGTLGVMDLQNKVLEALHGLRLDNCMYGLKIRNFRYSNPPLDNGSWTLQLEFYTTTPMSEAFELPDNPELETIIFNETIS
jgi:hypothetical protein